MIACYFRFDINDTSQWQGMAAAINMKDLFWEIDQYGDPYSCEIIEIQLGSYCVLAEQIEGMEDTAFMAKGYEPSQTTPFKDGQWTKPKWPEDLYS